MDRKFKVRKKKYYFIPMREGGGESSHEYVRFSTNYIWNLS